MMIGGRILRFAALGALLLATLGCVYPISAQLRQSARKDLPFASVFADPEAALGALVIWGGVILQTDNLSTGTMLTVLQYPLDWRDKPKPWHDPGGRFIVTTPQFLEPEAYWPGRRVTVAGDVAGALTQQFGDTTYRYPVLAARQIYLWPLEPVYPYYYWPYWYDNGPEWHGYGPNWYGYAPAWYGWNTNYSPYGGYNDFYGPFGYYDDWWDLRRAYGRKWRGDDRGRREERRPPAGTYQQGGGGGRSERYR